MQPKDLGLKEVEMFVGKFKCHHCKAMFELTSQLGSEKEQEAKCPTCGSVDIEGLPFWVPLTYNMDLYNSPSLWKYECHQCKTIFELPVPSGPTEEKQRKCPSCSSMDIARLTALALDMPVYCG
jgi:rRNA maturation endonuclease Nob1